MLLAQRIVAGLFTAFLWLISFSCLISVTHDKEVMALVTLLMGMGLALWALRPLPSKIKGAD